MNGPSTITLWPRRPSASRTPGATRSSTCRNPGANRCSRKLSWWCSELNRGASIASCGRMSNTATLRKTWSACWSWLSPPGLLRARNGVPSRSTTVGLSVVRGRLPPRTMFGWPSSRTNACMRLPSGTPVSPAMNVPPVNHADDGDAEKRVPRPSATLTVVVSSDGRVAASTAPLRRAGARPGGGPDAA